MGYRTAEDDCRWCFYCRAPLSVRHEHDHFPIAQRHGGDAVVAACLNCHDLKDRIGLRDWHSEVLDKAMGEAGPLGRILLAKVTAILADAEQEVAEARAAAEAAA